MRWQVLGAVVLVVVGIGAAALAVAGPNLGATAETQYLTSQAAVTDVVEQVAATGTLEAATTYALAFGSPPTESSTAAGATASSAASSGGVSWTVATVTATPGQAVKAGAVLATADPTDAELTLALANANLASAKARLAADKRGLTATEKAAAKLQVTQAQQSLSQARTSYSSTAAQSRLKLSQADAAVKRARTSYEDAKAANQPDATVDQAYSAWLQAKEALASLKLQVSQSNTQASNQIRQAELQVQSAQLTYKERTAKADAATLATDEAAVAQAQQAVAAAEAALGYASLVSPVDGVVVAVNVAPGLAAPSSAAITVRSTTFQVAAAVTESDLPLVELGQAAQVTITALDLEVTGTVARIDQEPSSSTSGVVSYGIVVALPEVPAGAVPGMSAEIAVTTASAADVVAVPSIALATAADGTYTVRVLDTSGQPQAVAVTVGLITSSLAEITSGLEAGTAVVVGTASEQQSGGTTITTGIPGLGGGGGFPGGVPGGGPGQRP